MHAGWIYPILDRFEVRREANGRWYALCPAHEDRMSSLSIWTGRDGKRLLVGCWAGCDKQDILASVGLRMRDLFEPENGPYERPRNRPPQLREIARYPYLDEEGILLYEAIRYEPKTFRYRRPVDGGRWSWSLDGARRVLYRLPEILARPEHPVLICEGEKDVHTAESLGFLATTNCGGCGMGWQDSYSLSLAGRRLVVIPDNNTVGFDRADRIVGSTLRWGAAAVRLAVLSGLGPDGDLTDWVSAGNGRQDLIALVRSTECWFNRSV